MLTCFSSKFICSTLVFLYSKDVVFLGLTFETVLGRSLLQECCILLFQLICCVWFSGASSFWWRSFFGLALSEWCLFPIPFEMKKCIDLKVWFRFCCFWGIRNQRYFILTDYFALSEEDEALHRRTYLELKAAQGICDDEFYHYDTPLTVDHETKALLEAGFSSVEILGQWGATYTIKATK